MLVVTRNGSLTFPSDNTVDYPKNDTKDETYIDQAKILRHRFKEKKYPTVIIKQAYQRAKKLS